MEMPDHLDADAIAEELNDCRQRGLDWLDRNTTNQRPVRPTVLERLAREYATARRIGDVGRIGQIKTLLRDGIAELARQGHSSDADLLRDLFYGESMDGPIAAPGVLLKKAQERFGDATPARFRERRTSVMRSFARFLIGFVSPAAAPVTHAEDQWQQVASVGYVADGEHFIRLLAEAVNITFVGITNEHLPDMLSEALRRKREAEGPDAFWSSARIVFLGRALLDVLADERGDLDPSRALGQRRQEAVWARRSVYETLRRASPARWFLYEYPYLPALNGALLEFADGRRVAHLLIRRVRRSRGEHVYIQLDDVGERLAAVFEDIVRDSVDTNMVVPVGFPAEGTFRYRSGRNLTTVLADGSGADGWLPMVLVVTPRHVGDLVLPMLQLRTYGNSARELGRLSHLAGYILQDDRLRPGGRAIAAPPTSFGLTDETPLSAAQRVVQEIAADDLSTAIRPVATGRYLYPDKEHLFLFVYVLELPESFPFPRRTEMHTFRLPEMLDVRASQILHSAAWLCQATDVSSTRLTVAAEIVGLNLCLHDQPELGQRLLDLVRCNRADRDSIAADIEALQTVRTYPSLVESGRDIEIVGLAGWQHREFFSVLLPLYSDIGVTGARELLDQIKGDTRKSAAVKRLADLYHDEDRMASLPVVLS
jgi:hypothetical protein